MISGEDIEAMKPELEQLDSAESYEYLVRAREILTVFIALPLFRERPDWDDVFTVAEHLANMEGKTLK